MEATYTDSASASASASAVGRMWVRSSVAVWFVCFPVILLGGCSVLEPDPIGRISAASSGQVASGAAVLGRFEIRLKGGDPAQAFLSVRDSVEKRDVIRSIAGEAFLGAASGRETVDEKLGSFFLKDRVRYRCRRQTVSGFESKGNSVVLRGDLSCQGEVKSVPYTLAFSLGSQRRLNFQLRVLHPDINRAYVSFGSSADERFFGFGEQFTYFDLKGRRVPLLVMEQGVGRGAQPITFGADVTARSGGDWHTSYAPIPYTITSRLRAIFLENSEYSVFDMRRADRVVFEVFSNTVSGAVLSGDSPGQLVEDYTAYAGRMRPLPDWVHSGAIVGLQGGTRRVREILARLKGASVPVAAFWVQDWEGQRLTKFGKQLWWNWELDQARYPNWPELRRDLERDRIRLMVYINPFLVDASTKEGHPRNLFAEAKRKGYLVRTEQGQALILQHVGFPAALLDLSNPAARAWIKGVIKSNLIGVGASGWMADFGEGLPFDARLFSGSPREFHNRYPEEWAQVNREAIREAGRENDIVFFNRSGYTRSPRHSTLFWLGDQLVSWDRHDGIKTAVTGLLSGGLSGYAFNHSDIGGYTTITNPLMNYHRSKELQMRWTELAAFTAVFRTHEGNRPDANHQFHSDAETLKHFSRMARVFRALFPYRKELVTEASLRGWPIVRPLFFHFPNDTRTYSIDYQQFLFGSELLVAPILDRGATTKQVYLPDGNWVNVWTGETQGGGRDVVVPAPLGRPPVFFRAGSRAGEAFRAALSRDGLL